MTGTVPVNKELLAGTVPVNKEILAGRVPVNKELLAGRVPVNNLFLSIICMCVFSVFSDHSVIGRYHRYWLLIGSH